MRTVAKTFQKDLAFLEHHYSNLLKEHGDTPRAVQWADVLTQERRMAVLSEVGDLRSAKILDFGCGTGHLLDFLRRKVTFSGEYVGYDISQKMVTAAQAKFPEIRFEKCDILTEGIGEDFDYILINGVFNNRTENSWELMGSLLKSLFGRAQRGMAFNALSTYVDFFDPELFYVSPEVVFRFCKEELSSSVILRHDYLIRTGVVPFEFSIYVYTTDIKSRKSLAQ
jgi:SAM-dependent methyltransferase